LTARVVTDGGGFTTSLSTLEALLSRFVLPEKVAVTEYVPGAMLIVVAAVTVAGVFAGEEVEKVTGTDRVLPGRPEMVSVPGPEEGSDGVEGSTFAVTCPVKVMDWP
jgi:hypothetical protein